MNAPLDKKLVDDLCIANGLRNARELGAATIRQFVSVVSAIEQATGERYIRMEMGVPGLTPSQIGTEAERKALLTGIASQYPNITGIDPLKKEAARFIKAFVDLDISPDCIVPTVGSMQGAFVSLLAVTQMGPKLESYLAKGNIAAVVFSNPNNPSWMCLTESELRTIGELATRYDTVVIEDLAYLNMDFREDRSQPFRPPYQPSVARYTKNYLLLLSSSKIFSYAGQRGALVVLSDELAARNFDGFAARYGSDGNFGRTFVHSILYAMSAGVTHSVQYAMAAMFKAASDGEFNYVEQVREYGRRAQRVKEIMLRNGFHIVYDKDCEQQVGDGFFFTFGYKDMTGEQLINKLIYYGISAITLDSTGSARQGLRGCTSNISDDQYEELDKRLKLFSRDY